MKTRKMLTGVVVCVAQVSLLLAGAPLPSSALASANDGFSSHELTKVDDYEKTLFGKVRGNLSPESRLRAIETNLFGGQKTGSTQQRLDAVQRVIGKSKSDFLMPPMAPTLDTGSGEIAEAPPVASRDNSSSYDSDSASDSGSNSTQDEDLIREAMEQYSNGQTDKAERSFKSILAQNPSNADAHFNLGVIAEGKGDLNGALKSYSEASKLNPSDRELQKTVQSLRTKVGQSEAAKRTEIAERQAQESKHQDAAKKKYLRDIVADASNDYKAGRYTEAVNKLEKVSREAPSDPDVHYALGQAYKAKGDLHQARGSFDRAIAIDPSNNLYKGAVTELNGMVAQKAKAADPAPAGEITPFSDTIASDNGRSGSGSAGQGYDAAYGSGVGYDYRASAKRFSSSRLTRTIAGSALGAAAGVAWGASTRGSLKSNALKGALLGGIFGYMTGR